MKTSQMYGESRVEGDFSETELPLGAQLRKIYVDTNNPISRDFEKWGHNFYNVFVQNGKGQWISDSGLKYWEQDGTYRKILPRNTPVYPFEQLENDIQQVINEEKQKTRFEIVRRDYTHNGFSGFWTLISPDIRQVIKGSYVVDDEVQIGLVIRNGIATGVSLGADFYTYRLKCLNGAIGRGPNFGSMSIRHVGDQSKMIDIFKEGIPVILKLGQRILEYYEMATAFKFDEKMAQLIYKKTPISEKYYPDYFHIDKDQKDLEKQVTLTVEGKQLSLWEVFNDFTERLTKSFNMPDTKVVKGEEKNVSHIGFSGFSHTTRALHQALTHIVDNRSRNKSEVA